MPDIRYAKNVGTSIAYHIVGDGPIDLVYVPDYVSNLVYAWETPRWRTFYERLARSFRLILFEKRGTASRTADASSRRSRRAWRTCTPCWTPPGRSGAVGAALAGPGEVLVSSTVKDLVAGSGIEFDDRGEHELKGVGPWRLYSVLDA